MNLNLNMPKKLYNKTLQKTIAKQKLPLASEDFATRPPTSDGDMMVT